MSLKPVDMVTMVPRLTDVSKVQQIKEQEGQVAGQQFAAQLKTKVAHEQQMVNDAPKTIRTEAETGRRKGGGRRGNQHDAEEQPASQSDAKPPQRGKGDPAAGKGSVIDIILGGQA